MFTGIIETIGRVKSVKINGSNRVFQIESPLSHTFKPDQSVSHSGVCLTVEAISGNIHQVTAIEETLLKTNVSEWEEGTIINLERCLQMNGRLDGHIVQGHVDTTATCIRTEKKEGSTLFHFETDPKFAPLMIEKGSISLNGISLTIFNVTNNSFTVAIVPYTFEHTNIYQLQAGNSVNIEFDMIGKYVNRLHTISGHV